MKKLSAANDSRRRTAIELLNYSRNEQTPKPKDLNTTEKIEKPLNAIVGGRHSLAPRTAASAVMLNSREKLNKRPGLSGRPHCKDNRDKTALVAAVHNSYVITPARCLRAETKQGLWVSSR